MTTLSPFSGSPGMSDPLLTVPNQAPFVSITQPKIEINPNDIKNNSGAPIRTATDGKKPTTKGKPRKRVNTAEKRHQHNAVERQRRETLNGKFVVLARLLPALATHRRPSKSSIVNGSISHLTYQRNQRLLATNLLRQMAAEQEALLQEVNEWRRSNGFPPKESLSAKWIDGMNEVSQVEQETFGTFANDDGEDGDDDDNDNDMPIESGPMPIGVSFTQSTGLVTPRPSTDLHAMIDPAQAIINSIIAPETRTSTASSNATFGWSNDFAWSINNAPPQTATPAFFSSSIFGDSVEVSSSDSPATSQQGNVVTPPTHTDMFLNHSPSPRSSTGFAASIEEVKPAQQSSVGWTSAQVLFAQQQLQLQRQRQHSQQHQQFAAALNPSFQPQPAVNQPLDSDLFTQQLMASMFTTNNASPAPGQIEQWRKNALGGGAQQRHSFHQQASVHDLRNAVRLGMGSIDSSSWGTPSNRPLEGF